jgi:hypothetical protein
MARDALTLKTLYLESLSGYPPLLEVVLLLLYPDIFFSWCMPLKEEAEAAKDRNPWRLQVMEHKTQHGTLWYTEGCMAS